MATLSNYVNCIYSSKFVKLFPLILSNISGASRQLQLLLLNELGNGALERATNIFVLKQIFQLVDFSVILDPCCGMGLRNFGETKQLSHPEDLNLRVND